MMTRSITLLTLFVLLCSGPLNGAWGAQVIVGSEKNPALVPQLTDRITVDGDPAKWEKIRALPAPYSRKEAGSLKLAWNADGLYGCLQVKVNKIRVDTAVPWHADAVELWLEQGAARSEEMNSNTCQIAFVPNPAAGAGKCTVVVPQGPISIGAINASWRPSDSGYVIEFFIPASELKVAKMAEGTKLGLNYAIDHEGNPIEQFYCDKEINLAYCNPSEWGMILLSK